MNLKKEIVYTLDLRDSELEIIEMCLETVSRYDYLGNSVSSSAGLILKQLEELK